MVNLHRPTLDHFLPFHDGDAGPGPLPLTPLRTTLIPRDMFIMLLLAMESPRVARSAMSQGLTLVHFSA
jgi:hypothetical protein